MILNKAVSRTGSSPFVLALVNRLSDCSKVSASNLIYKRQNSNKTCLYDFHIARKARMQPFAGFIMPIVYHNQTIRSEHIQTRQSASVFDVSHMMQTTIRGKDAYAYLESLTVADIEVMKLDKSALSLFTNAQGGIIDDCIISKREDHFHLVSNAGNSEAVWSWLNQNVPKDKDVKLEKLTKKGLIALQGPKAQDVLQGLVDHNLAELEFMNTCDASIEGIGKCQITRCGYTGEDGFEVSVDAKDASKLMSLLCADERVKPAGLGARDTLRLEAGLCLHGHDITPKTTPIEAALNWTIQKRRRIEGGFPGADIILKQLKDGVKIKRVGLIATSSGPPVREGYRIIDTRGENVELGWSTSGTHAPSLGQNIAMAYIDSELEKKWDHLVQCEIRGKRYDYKITKMPFVKPKYYVKK